MPETLIPPLPASAAPEGEPRSAVTYAPTKIVMVPEDGMVDMRPFGCKPGDRVTLLAMPMKTWQERVDEAVFEGRPLPGPSPEEVAEGKRQLAEMRERFTLTRYDDPDGPAVDPASWHAVDGDPADAVGGAAASGVGQVGQEAGQ